MNRELSKHKAWIHAVTLTGYRLPVSMLFIINYIRPLSHLFRLLNYLFGNSSEVPESITLNMLTGVSSPFLRRLVLQ